MGDGPEQVQEACERAVAQLMDAVTPSAVTGSRQQWAEAAASAQRAIDVASAVQDAAIARLAAIEPGDLEDGTEVESHRGLGHVALDAPAILSGALRVSDVHAQRRVRAAVRLAADGPDGSATQTGLRALHDAMAAGRLDAYRAGVVADELVEAPPQVAATVVAALDPHFEVEDGAHLRRRCRRVLARISPDLLVQRARRAREECGLRRWVDEPGVDRWEGTFPSEDAAQAWAAIDALAQRYVAEDVCPTIERARAKALTDLVAGNATVTTVVTLTVPATALPEPGTGWGMAPVEPAAAHTDAAPPSPEPQAGIVPSPSPGDTAPEGDLVEVTGLSGGQPVLVSREWLTATTGARAGHDGATVSVAQCHPETGALLDQDWAAPPAPGTAPPAPGTAPPTPGTAPPTRGTPPRGSGASPTTSRDDRYRPAPGLIRHVKARDRRCRFPGCTVSAVFCDIDHVRAWPAGPTRPGNLMCLCRRHHRVKQRRGWRVSLAADGVATWTDPTGRVRTTMPADALHTVVLTGVAVAAEPLPSTSRPLTVLPDGPHSELEFLLEHLTAATSPRRRPITTWRDDSGRQHCSDVLPPRGVLVLDPAVELPHGRSRRLATHPGDDDVPPF